MVGFGTDHGGMHNTEKDLSKVQWQKGSDDTDGADVSEEVIGTQVSMLNVDHSVEIFCFPFFTFFLFYDI